MLTQSGCSHVLLATVSLYYIPLHPRTYSLPYSVSCLVDALDGATARYFEQKPQFGAVLDMVTDRCTTLCPVECIPKKRVSQMEHCLSKISQLVLCWSLYTLYYIAMGGNSVSHKEMGAGRPRAMRLYYRNTVG